MEIHIFTDHKNLTFKNFSSDRVTGWRLMAEEFNITWHYIEGPNNVVADALSRLPIISPVSSSSSSQECHMFEDFYMADHLGTDSFPVHFTTIQTAQQQAPGEMEAYTDSKLFGTERIKLFVKDNKIVVPRSLAKRIITFYHHHLKHPGETRTTLAIKQFFFWRSMTREIHDFVANCQQCKLAKEKAKNYGKLPVKEFNDNIMTPWITVHIDCIGPIQVACKYKEERNDKTWFWKTVNKKLICLTAVCAATKWFEIQPMKKIDSSLAKETFETMWLNRYPKPERVVHDNGKEFNGAIFQEMLKERGIKSVPTTVRNPQSNSVVERIHGILNNIARVSGAPVHEVLDIERPFDRFVSDCAYAIRSTINTIMQASPGQIVFGRDMIMPITFNVDWNIIRERRQQQAIRENNRENARRLDYPFTVGDYVFLSKNDTRGNKHARKRDGPFLLKEINQTNGTVKIDKGGYTEVVNLRRISPERP